MDAVVREVNGQIVLDDPAAAGVFAAVDAYNRGLAARRCETTRAQNADRIAHFARRIRERGLRPDDVVIVILCVDDPHGAAVAEGLMPGHDWQSYRNRGEVPYARGLAGREGIQDVLALIDTQAADRLRSLAGGVATVVMDGGGVAVFEEPTS